MKRTLGLLLAGCGCAVAATYPPALQVAGRPVELTLSAVSAHTVRLTVSELGSYRTPKPVTDDPVLVQRSWPSPQFRLRSVLPAETVQVAGIEIKIDAKSLELQLARSGKEFQKIGISDDGSFSFRTGTEPLFGLGEGGPQFDRRGLYSGNDLNGSPYNTSVFVDHIRVPLVMSPSGWAIFTHAPLGTFDLRGDEGHFHAGDSQPPLPLDLFVTAVDEPAALLTEYSAL